MPSRRRSRRIASKGDDASASNDDMPRSTPLSPTGSPLASPPIMPTGTSTTIEGGPPKQRKRAHSFFSSLSASKSASRLPDVVPPPLPATRPSSRSSTRTSTSGRSTRSTWTLFASKTNWNKSPYLGRPPGSTPELTSTNKATRLSKLVTAGSQDPLPAVEPKAVRPMLPSPSANTTTTTAAQATFDQQRFHTPPSPVNPQPNNTHQHHTLLQRTPSEQLPDVPRPRAVDRVFRHRPAQSEAGQSIFRRTQPDRVDLEPPPEVADKRKSKFVGKRIPGVLSRNKSLRGDRPMTPSSSVPSTPTRVIVKPANGTPLNSQTTAVISGSLPVDKERSFKSTFKSNVGRTRSEDRGGSEHEPEKLTKSKKKDKKIEEKSSKDGLGKSHNKSNGTGFFHSSKGSDGFGITKASRGFFSKLTRSTSSNEKVGAGLEEDFEPRLLKLPLVEQTRETRIAKSYDNCRDKTEFWMPALPWRCIDYLNGKCEEEGLYRVSGGLTMVRRWRRRFDTERDVNLLDEPDLYDASVIASLFKEWIRELPEEIFPKSRQAKVVATLPTEVPGKKPVPQSLRDELSDLPPFNYYLLFAITCHLSLLLSHEPKNKMTLDNLYRCFNQSLKLDGRIFYTLVGDWRQCWQGCYTENEFLRAEYDYLNTPYPEYPELERRPPPTDSVADDRAVTSSSGSAASGTGRSTPEVQRPATSQTQPSHSTEETEAEAVAVHAAPPAAASTAPEPPTSPAPPPPKSQSPVEVP